MFSSTFGTSSAWAHIPDVVYHWTTDGDFQQFFEVSNWGYPPFFSRTGLSGNTQFQSDSLEQPVSAVPTTERRVIPHVMCVYASVIHHFNPLTKYQPNLAAKKVAVQLLQWKYVAGEGETVSERLYKTGSAS